MAKKVQVTSAQRRAAQTIVERSAMTGRYVRPGVSKIAESASGTHHRSTVAGRYVTSATTARRPKSTVTESSGNSGRSAASTTASQSPIS